MARGYRCGAIVGELPVDDLYLYDSADPSAYSELWSPATPGSVSVGTSSLDTWYSYSTSLIKLIKNIGRYKYIHIIGSAGGNIPYNSTNSVSVTFVDGNGTNRKTVYSASGVTSTSINATVDISDVTDPIKVVVTASAYCRSSGNSCSARIYITKMWLSNE